MRVERQVLFWLAAMLLVVLALLALKDVLLPFLIGIVIAYALNPLADRMARLGMSRAAASTLIVAGMVVVLVLLLVFLVPLLAIQVQQMGLSLPGEFERLRGLLEGWAKERLGDRFGDIKVAFDRAVADLSSNWSSLAGIVAKSVWAQGLALVNFLSLLLITPLVVFYLLVDWHPMLQRIETWLPRDHKATIERLAGEINDAISAFIRGQGLVCLALGIIYALGLTWVGLRYGLLIGLATGVLSFIPFVGWALGLLTASTLALLQFWPDTVPLLKVLGVFAFGQAIDAAFLSPKIVGSKIGLHPVWLIAALFVFSYLFGFAGVLVAVPVAAAIAVLVRFALEVYLDSTIYKGRGGEQPPNIT
ncbi:MAG: AI-2E family transporter [Hyphomicrobiaceae bacterium]